MARVFVTRGIDQEGLDILNRGVSEVNVWDKDEPIPREELLREIRDCDGVLSLVTERVDQEFLDAAPKCKVVANMDGGYNNIDVDACTRRKVVVSNTPGVLTETTADLAWAIMMAAARHVVPATEYVKAGNWQTWDPRLFVGRDIHHATIGIVGMGRIGQEIAKRARGFDMNIIYSDTYRREDLEQQFGYRYAEIDELLRESDFVTVHVDPNPSTEKMFNRDAFRAMKNTAYLVNAARGPMVDTEALYEALSTGQIAGAALDVTDPEPLPAEHPLLTLNNVVVVPHIASASLKTRAEMAVLAAENIVAVLKGERPKTPVNPEVLDG